MHPLLLATTLAVSVSPDPAPTAKQAFERLKTLAGTWEGKAGEGADAVPTKVIYKVTGMGSALVETQFPDTANEMITVYHLDGEKLLLTHYCAAQNQPRMRYTPGKDASVLKFDFVSASNMKPKDAHMHNLTLRFVGKDHIVSEWAFYANGKAGNVAKFDMRRSK
jgi:hypothetical protein